MSYKSKTQEKNLAMKPKFKVVDESNRFLYALCPFHKETKPSLCINRVPNNNKPKGFWYCYGCAKYGEISSQEVDELSKNINVSIIPVVESDVDWDTLHNEYYLREFTEGKGKLLAEKWGVSPSIIQELGIGFDGYAHTIPMYNLDKIVGIQRQFINGYKCMVSRSQLGLIVPMTMSTGSVLFMPEGASDLACLLDIGCRGIARPNALVGKELVYNWLRRYNPVYDRIVIVADNDNAGIQGAEELANYIDSEAQRTTIWLPTQKDLRKEIKVDGKKHVKNILRIAGGLR